MKEIPEEFKYMLVVADKKKIRKLARKTHIERRRMS